MIILTLAFLVIIIAAFVSFAHYCMGSPSGGESEPDRIFSFIGRWVTDGYKRFEASEQGRLTDKLNKWLAKSRAAIKTEEDKANHAKKSTEKLAGLEKGAGKRANYWMAFGACFTCFATWMSLALWSVTVLVMGLSWWWAWLCVPITVYVARRVDI